MVPSNRVVVIMVFQLSEREVLGEIAEAERAMERDDIRALRLWERVRHPVSLWNQAEYPDIAGAWVVGLLGSRCLCFNPVEGGWGWGRFESAGSISIFHWQQDDLVACIRMTLFAVDHGGMGIEVGAPVRDAAVSRTRSCSPGFFVAHAATGCGYAILSVCVLDRYDPAVGRTGSLWLYGLTYVAFASIGVLAWWAAARVLLASGRFRGPKLLVAAFSGVASALALVLFAPGGGDPIVWLGLAVLVPAVLAIAWTGLSIGGLPAEPR